ncbi:hypothetical protein PF002_g15920 [Phytophthora fragariae]|uniref:Uncharacterized protein n=1 Tax=Phytophthora fragariae TaxID=53985 RepID=A0A6A3YMR2_9STRA|nr:hypothetical protein PF003_g821 [Phytophthora fragariae]KAE9104809.1 hypothetical protein PF007_g13931 [Phytophthora fragariae]KAE9141898.1 hypothetical protein PF006_g12952 [Phytophthora fragariae]KAE9220368.1 hypothetical protein PF002_g15920 [Phytophthora fragariae]KAE9311283.1 hypothetical protein PF001_g9805 [Phytophthora fragariae]
MGVDGKTPKRSKTTARADTSAHKRMGVMPLNTLALHPTAIPVCELPLPVPTTVTSIQTGSTGKPPKCSKATARAELSASKSTSVTPLNTLAPIQQLELYLSNSCRPPLPLPWKNQRRYQVFLRR